MLYLVRHGRTRANAERRLQGRVDNPIDEVGRQQAAALAPAFERIDRLVCSPLLRARQTAEALAGFGCRAEIDERWQEIDYGVMDGTCIADVSRETLRAWIEDADYASEGGETMRELATRVWAACNDLAEAARDSEVVVVTHATPIRVAMTWAIGADLASAWRCHIDPATITTITFRGRLPLLAGFNQTP